MRMGLHVCTLVFNVTRFLTIAKPDTKAMNEGISYYQVNHLNTMAGVHPVVQI